MFSKAFFSRVIESMAINSLPNDKILDQSKLKALALDTRNVNRKIKLVLGRVENILGKGKNAGYQHFLLFSKCFQKPPSPHNSLPHNPDF